MCIICSGVIIPPSWIVKLPRKGSFKSSIRHSPKKVSSDKSAGREIAGGVSEDSGDAEACRCKSGEDLCSSTAASGGRGPAGVGGSGSSAGREHQTFLLKPIPVSNSCPVIVFLNPKSGGNQGRCSYNYFLLNFAMQMPSGFTRKGGKCNSIILRPVTISIASYL